MACNPFQADCAGPPVIVDGCSRAADLAQLVLDTSIDTVAPMLCPGSDCEDVLHAYIAPTEPLPVSTNTVAVWLDGINPALTPFDVSGTRMIMPKVIEQEILVSGQLYLGPFDMGSMDERGTYTYPDFDRLTAASAFALKVAQTWWRDLASMWADNGGHVISPLTPVPGQGLYASWGVTLRAIGS